MKTVLFVCSQNRLRSPAAEQVESAGTNHDAHNPLTHELVAWARQAAEEIPDKPEARQSDLPRHSDCEFMDPELVRLLEASVSRYLNASFGRSSA